MLRIRYLTHGLLVVFFTYLFLPGSLESVDRVALTQTGVHEGEEVSGSLVDTGAGGITHTYLPTVRKSGPTEVCGEITADTTWTIYHSPYQVTCDVIVPTGVTLSIAAGVWVQFQHSEDDLIVAGVLETLGTTYGPVRFQPLSGAEPGSWGRVAYLPGSSGQLDHAILEYGGSSEGMLSIASDEVQISHSTVQYSGNTGISINAGSPLIRDSQILTNSGTLGAGVAIYSGAPILQNNLLAGNQASGQYGGGLYIDTGNPVIQNNVFTRNSALFGAGLANKNGDPVIQNNLIFDNRYEHEYPGLGGGIYIFNGDARVRNNIIMNNTGSNGGGIYVDDGNPMLDYNDVWYNPGGDYAGVPPGLHDVSADPLLVGPAHGDFHLAPGSPCIDAGDPAGYPEVDFDGDPRPMGSSPDIGIDEFRSWLVTKASQPDEAAPGDGITYTVEVANLSISDLASVQLTDTLSLETAFLSYQADGMSCAHDGSPWGGQLHCVLEEASLPPGAQREIVLSVRLTETLTTPHEVINTVTVSVISAGHPVTATARTRTWVSYCRVQLNDQPVGSDLQAAINASRHATDVIRVADHCYVQDLVLDKNLTLQGGWNSDFSLWDPSVYTTTLDGQSLGRVIEVEGMISPTIASFVILGGKTSGPGGGMLILSGSPTIQDNIFIGNEAPFGGGLYTGSGHPLIKNNLFRNNMNCSIIEGEPYCDNPYGYGGGIYNGSGAPTIVNNVFAGNSATGMGLKYSGSGGGIYNLSGNPLVQSNTFSLNLAGGSGGGFRNVSGNPVIENNLFIGNTAYEYSGQGGGMSNADGSPVIRNNQFIGNQARGVTGAGGGLANSSGTPLIVNNVFSDNSAFGSHGGIGGGLYSGAGGVDIQNNTFYRNSAGTQSEVGECLGGGLAVSDYTAIRNNIIISNTACGGGGIYSAAGDHNILDYNDVWSNIGGDYLGVTPGAHDITLDPLLVDPASADFHLAPGSPCIDAGDPANYPPVDFEGDPRPNGVAPDIGADEYVAWSADR